MKKNCLICQKEISKPTRLSIKDWLSRKKYCSRECTYKALHQNNLGRRTGEYKKCVECGKTFYIIQSHLKRRATNGQYCSRDCIYKSPLWKEKISGENNYLWKGENSGYRAKHHWVNRILGKAIVCQFCGKEGLGRDIQWANKDHKYLRISTDWQSLCARCHTQYDIDHNLRDVGGSLNA